MFSMFKTNDSGAQDSISEKVIAFNMVSSVFPKKGGYLYNKKSSSEEIMIFLEKFVFPKSMDDKPIPIYVSWINSDYVEIYPIKGKLSLDELLFVFDKSSEGLTRVIKEENDQCVFLNAQIKDENHLFRIHEFPLVS